MLLNNLGAMFWGLTLFASCAQADIPAPNWGLEQINVNQALNIAHSKGEILIAVIDTGVDVLHPSLKNNIWVNPGESGIDKNGKDKSKNGIDDDRNGYIDDLNGWNFVENTNSVVDSHGHGTHVSGIIAAREHGIGGTVGAIRIMVLKYIDPKLTGYDAVGATVKCIQYAVKMKARIINYSSGGFMKSPLEEAAIREAAKQNILFVAAAGNESMDSDKMGYYPANYPVENIISVTAVDQKMQLIPVANYGAQRVQIAAPGKDIVSTMPGGKFGKMTGTSQATAFVTGVAALLLLADLDLKEPSKIIQRLTQTSQMDESLFGKTLYQSHVDAYRALALKPSGVSAFGARTTNTAQLDSAQFSSSILDDISLNQFRNADVTVTFFKHNF